MKEEEIKDVTRLRSIASDIEQLNVRRHLRGMYFHCPQPRRTVLASPRWQQEPLLYLNRSREGRPLENACEFETSRPETGKDQAASLRLPLALLRH